MILLLYADKCWVTKYAKYLQEENISHIALPLSDFFNTVKIHDSLSSGEMKTKWQYNEREISFDDVTAVYQFIPMMDSKYFKDYIPEDVQYAKDEYYAYLLYRLSCFKRTVNSISPVLSSTTDLSLPAIYKCANSLGISTPNYCISGDRKALTAFASKQKVLGSKDLFSFHHLEPKHNIAPNDIMLAASEIGAPTIVHKIGKKIFTSIVYREGKKIFDLPQELEEKCLRLAERLQIDVAELYFKRTLNDEYVLYYVSALPNLDSSMHSKNVLWPALTEVLQLN